MIAQVTFIILSSLFRIFPKHNFQNIPKKHTYTTRKIPDFPFKRIYLWKIQQLRYIKVKKNSNEEIRTRLKKGTRQEKKKSNEMLYQHDKLCG